MKYPVELWINITNALELEWGDPKQVDAENWVGNWYDENIGFNEKDEAYCLKATTAERMMYFFERIIRHHDLKKPKENIMQKYIVDVVETIEVSVEVQAESEADAIRQVEDMSNVGSSWIHDHCPSFDTQMTVREPEPEFMCFWNVEVFPATSGELEKRDGSFFTEGHGYTRECQKQILEMAVGENWISDEWGHDHIVTRIR